MGSLGLIGFVAVVFWVIQVIDLMMRDESEFESHTHKLLWFVALWTGNIVAAIWYFSWKRGRVRKTLE